MALVIGLALLLWGIGHLMNAPIPARLTMIALLFVAVLGIQVTLPDGHPLRAATGGSALAWLVLGGAGLAVWVYAGWVRGLKARAKPEPKPAAPSARSELERNARHIVLREIGGPGQKRLKEAKVLVVGAGGLGAPALLYLAAAGVGTVGVIDDDVVENSNLQRQVIHTDDRIGMPKVFSAQKAMEAQNPFVTVRPYNRRLTDEIARGLFADYDLILDGTDDAPTRYLVNETAVALEKPLISAAISQWEGQISLFDPARGGPCYRCVFPEPAAEGLAPSCAVGGVLGPLPGVLGAMMAVEAVKHLARTGETLRGRMLIYDALYADTRLIGLKARPDCPVCQGRGAAA